MSTQSSLGWTPAARAAFIEHLSRCGIVLDAAKAVGLSAQSAYGLRNRDPEFMRAWDTARDVAREHIADTVYSRALDGWQEEVWYKGEMVGHRQRQNPMLLLRLLERLDRVTGNDGHVRRHGANQIGKVIDAIATEESADILFDPPEWEMHDAMNRARRSGDWGAYADWKARLEPYRLDDGAGDDAVDDDVIVAGDESASGLSTSINHHASGDDLNAAGAPSKSDGSGDTGDATSADVDGITAIVDANGAITPDFAALVGDIMASARDQAMLEAIGGD